MVKYEKFDGLKNLLESRKSFDRVFSKTKQKKAHYASGGIGCKRQAVYDFIGTPESPIDVTTRIIFGLGDAGQELIEKEFIGCKIFDAREQSIELQDPKLKYSFSMRIDALVTLPAELDADMKMRPIEVKTSGGSQYYTVSYKSWNDLPPRTFHGSHDVPKDYHMQQLMLYLKAMNLDWGMLLVINRDDGNYVIYKVYYDEDVYQAIVKHCGEVEAELEVYKSTGVLPARILEPLPITVYKRNTENNKIGDFKLDKSSFPCAWQSKESGRYGACKYINTCHKETFEALGLKGLPGTV